MKGNTRKGNLMVRGYSHLLMEKSMLGNSRNGNFWNGTTYEIDGNFFGKLVNGKLKVK